MEDHEERCLPTSRAQTGANPVLVKVRDSGGVVFQFLLRVAEKEQS
jgi:hypothetical protein